MTIWGASVTEQHANKGRRAEVDCSLAKMRDVVDLGHLALQRPVTKPAAQIDYEPRHVRRLGSKLLWIEEIVA